MFWHYQETQVNSLEQLPEGVIGFVYRITNLDSGMFYIGKKQVQSTNNKPLTKKEQEAWDKPGRIPKKKKVVTESNWLKYWGSSKSLQEDIKKVGQDKFKREILHLCYSKKQLGYWEVYYQFKYKVLHLESYNDNIQGKWFRKDI